MKNVLYLLLLLLLSSIGNFSCNKPVSAETLLGNWKGIVLTTNEDTLYFVKDNLQAPMLTFLQDSTFTLVNRYNQTQKGEFFILDKLHLRFIDLSSMDTIMTKYLMVGDSILQLDMNQDGQPVHLELKREKVQ